MKGIVLLIVLTIFTSELFAQLKEFEISPLPKPEISLVQANTEFGEDALIIIYSSLTNLNFRSSMGMIDKQSYNPQSNRYEILVKPQKQILFVFANGFMEGYISTFSPKNKEVFYFKIEEKQILISEGIGNIDIASNPNNCDIFLNGIKIFDKTPAALEVPIGVMKISLRKSGYISRDTSIRIKENSKHELSLSLKSNLPVLITNDVDSISFTSAYGGGKILFRGGSSIIERGICWSKEHNPTNLDNVFIIDSQDSLFNNTFVGLRPNVRYFYRAYAINSFGIAYGEEKSFTTMEYSNGVYSKGKGVKDVDGNFYSTVILSNGQEWMSQNLHVSKFNNGDVITNQIERINWQKSNIPAWVHYNNDILYDSIFGKLYNWFAVSDSRKLCPTGWHVPSVSDWNYLSEYLGGNSVAGGKMKQIESLKPSESYWKQPNVNASNLSGFAAQPGGYRNAKGIFLDAGSFASFWSSTEPGNGSALEIDLFYRNESLKFGSDSKKNGFSIRCLRN
jgi:uncharacterized protein (TIGR02145 family)